jgi:FtsP/CotA-like multicopper oxidase with cupredoxin domain
MRALALIAVVAGLFGSSTRPARTDSTIMPNDNRHSAGVLNGHVLTVRLEARNGTWFPEGPKGHGIATAAFAEEGKPLQTPGPLIRVPVGTEVHASVRNTFDRALTLYGFGAKRGKADSVVIPPKASRDVRFMANAPGTYYYAAHAALDPFGGRLPDDTQLGGAIIVDSTNAPSVPNDRVFVLSWWFTLDTTSKTGLGRGTMALNGLSWPHSERLDLVQGDSVRWRVVNLTDIDHPMHLHGFYFQMRSKSDGVRDTVYTPNDQRLGVTEIINPYQTMSLAWLPSRPGHWIYHSHFAGHLSHLASLDTDHGQFDEHASDHHASDRPHQMYGLVLGIRVSPRGTIARDTRPARPLRITVREKANVYGTHPGYAFVLDGTPDAANPASLPVPAPTLVLQKGERVAVTIVNRSRDRAAIHWHGIELESYPDGVPGWSGHGTDILPSVAPNDSITVRFTPPRAGTFMYHSHFNEFDQITSGLYGAIVVLEPGQRLDPETDRIMLFSSAGPTTNVVAGPWTPTLLNGKAQPAPIDLRAGTRYRFRMINITSDVNTIVSLLDREKPVEWRAVAKDGATLPANQATTRPATVFFDPGEIYDFEYTPKTAGALTLKFGPPPAPPEFGLPKAVSVAVRVK